MRLGEVESLEVRLDLLEVKLGPLEVRLDLLEVRLSPLKGF